MHIYIYIYVCMYDFLRSQQLILFPRFFSSSHAVVGRISPQLCHASLGHWGGGGSRDQEDP
jgi:hypothetical protein